MNKFTASFDYSGSAPAASWMQSFINSLGFTKKPVKKSLLTWAITTSLDEDGLQTYLDKSIENDGKYSNGKLTGVDLSSAADDEDEAPADGEKGIAAHDAPGA